MSKITRAEKRALYGSALAIALPMMLQNGITNAVGLVDSLMVGTLGTESVTGVSICGQLIFVFNLAIFGAILARSISETGISKVYAKPFALRSGPCCLP